ncbi:MAG: YjgN family protein [Thiohalomonadaceae bacterium]
MESGNYMLVFRGQLVDGISLEQAKQNLQELFKLSQEKVEQLFSLSTVIVKRDLSHELAEKFQAKLQTLGMVTVIQPMVGSAARDMASAAGIAVGVHTGERTTVQARSLPFEFLGQGGEYFRIWIVNILLTILTLGIYSAWAKVRNHRYFFGNTRLDGHSFEYTASPIAILKGRLIAMAFLIVYLLSQEFMPMLSVVLFLVFLVALPWLVCRTMAFRNYHSRYRNLRFGFDGQYMGALKAFVLWPIAGVLSIGILMPYAIYKQKYFLVENSRYGTRHFVPDFSPKGVYMIYLVALGIAVAGLVLMWIPFIGPLFLMAAYLLAFAYVTANTSNLIYNQSNLDVHGFDSRLVFTRLAFIYFTNGLLILFTLGLAIPWAKVRLARYRAECLSLNAEGELDSFIAAEDQRRSALGEEIGEAFDIDIGL